MTPMHDWRRYVRSQLPRLGVSAEREIEIVDELALQLEATYTRAISAGATADEARLKAEAEVPDWTALARTLGKIERRHIPAPVAGAQYGGVMTGFIQDIRYALRALTRAPGFAAVSIVTLALGIGATTIVYSLVDGVLLRPLPIHEPDRVVLLRETVNGRPNSIAWLNFLDWKARATSYEQLAAWRGVTMNLTGIDRPRQLQTRHVTANLFTVLGVRPVIGRDFTDADNQPGAPRTALVSHGFWQRELGGNASAIGRQIMLDEVPVTVIGVLPEAFTVARQEDAFLPVGNFATPNSMFFRRGDHFGLAGIGRLKPSATVESANAEIVSIARQLEQEYPNTNSGNGAHALPLFEVLVSTARPMLFVLLGAVIAMLLIACVNLANLMLARAAGRAQEMAVRRSLGAARWRIARQMLTESLLLGLAGGLAGVALAFVGFEGVVALLPADQPRIHTVAINLRVLAVAAAISLGTGLLFGLVPAIQAATGRSLTLLRSARVTGTGQAGGGTRRALLFAEVALALVLVAGAGLMLRTMNNLLSIDPGFRSEQVISAQFNLPPRFDAPKRLVFATTALERILAVPGVTNAAVTTSLPVAGSNWNSVFVVEGQPVPPRNELPSAAWTPVSAGYFDTMGIRLVRGRGFEAGDIFNAPEVVVVNQTLARRFFGDNDPIGARVKQGWPEDKTPWRVIVGVVNDVKVASLQGDPTLQAYLPITQRPLFGGAFVTRTNGDPRLVGRAIEAAIHEVEPNLPVFNIRTMDDVIEAGIGNERLTMVLLMGFAALALLMAAIGVFGVTSYSVSQRTHELGVRMALGANPSSVLALVVRQEMGACLIGVVAGVLGAVLLSSLLDSLLFGVAPRDTLTLSAAAGVLLLVTAIACLIPARRATRVDPVTALRLE
jgi:putative ABC transport system permease protein